MYYKTVLLFAVLNLNLSPIHGTEQHMMCKTVEDEFTILKAATAEIKSKIQNLEKKVAEISDILHCSTGGNLSYRGKCYYAVVHEERDVEFPDAEGMCTDNGGKLADILNREHQRLVENYLRGWIPDGKSNIDIWTANTYTSSTDTLRLSNGNVVTSLGWLGQWPSPNSSRTKVAIYIYKSTSTSSGIYNAPPTFKLRDGVLCVK